MFKSAFKQKINKLSLLFIMRFKIDFKLPGEGPYSIPLNYQREISSWIYKMLHFQNQDFKNWLTENKYLDNNGEYKLYTFSDVDFGPAKLQGERMIIKNNQAVLYLSFYAPKEITSFIISIFKEQEFKIGDSTGKTTIKIEDLSEIAVPDFSKLNNKVAFSCISPILIADRGNSSETFLSPDEKDFDKAFFKNLMFKYANMVKHMKENSGGLANLSDLRFKLTGKPKTKIVKIKLDTPHHKAVKGYMFDFEIKAPVELLKIGYDSGFGELNDLGFGCCEVK